MTRRHRGFLNKLRDSIPISRASARKQAHEDLIKAARIQLCRGVMEGMTHALSKKDEPIAEPEKIWWKAQTAKWETIWGMLNESCTDLDDFKKLSDLGHLSDMSFNLYEQMAVSAMTLLCEVPPEILQEEGVRWRTIATLISSLHRHCLICKLDGLLKPGKNAPLSGIKELKER